MISVHIANKRKNAKDNKDIDTKKLFLNYLSIIRIDLVPVEYTWVAELHLNHNMLRSLAGIEQFKNLRVLQLKFNFLTHVSELNRVANKHLLVDLNIKGNPIISRADPQLTLDNMRQNLFENLQSFNQDDYSQEILKKKDVQLKVDESNLMKEHLKSQMRKDTFEEIKAKQIQCAEEISVAISFQREQSLQNIAKLQKHTNIVQQNLSSLQKNIQQQQLLEHFFSKIMPDSQSIQTKLRTPQGIIAPTTPLGKNEGLKIQKTPREISNLNCKFTEKVTKQPTNSFLSSREEPKSLLKTLVQQIIPKSKDQFERTISVNKRETTPRQKLSCEQYLVQKGGTLQATQDTKLKSGINENQKEKYLLKRRNIEDIQTAKYSSMRLDFSPMSQTSAATHWESFRTPSASSSFYPSSTTNRSNQCKAQQENQSSINRQPSKSAHNSFLNHSSISNLINQSSYEQEGGKQNDKIHNHSQINSHSTSGIKSQNALSINENNNRKPFTQLNLQSSQLKNSFVARDGKEDAQKRSSSAKQLKQNQASPFSSSNLILKEETSFSQNSKNYLTPRVQAREIENIPPLLDNWQTQNNSQSAIHQRKGNKSVIIDYSSLNRSPFRSNRDQQLPGYQLHNMDKGKSSNSSTERFGSASNSAIKIQAQFKMIDKSLDCTEQVSQENYTSSTDQGQHIQVSQENIETQNTVSNQSVQLRSNLFQFQRLNTFNQIELGPYEEDSLPTCRRNKQQSICHGLQEQECESQYNSSFLPSYLNQTQNLEISSQRLVEKHIDDIDNDIDELAKKYYRGILLNKVFRAFKEVQSFSSQNSKQSEEMLFYRKALSVKAFYSWKSYLASEKNAKKAYSVINFMRNKNRL